MGLFKKKVVREIDGGAWGHLVSVHNYDVDTLSRSIRCVQKEGLLEGGMPVTFLRVFDLREIEKSGVKVESWETFEENPHLVLFEGYVTLTNKAFLERKNGHV